MTDIISIRQLVEFKAYTPFHVRPALGLGSAKGGAPSTADGWFVAFGNILESLRKRVLGLRQRGRPDEHQLDRTTGRGHVAACDGDYADALQVLQKGFDVLLFVVESTGAVADHGVRFLRSLSKQMKTPGHTDGTVYGSSRLATRSFFVHHLAAVSSAVVLADALTLENTAAALTFHSTYFPSLPPRPAA